VLRFGDIVLDRDARPLFRGGIQEHLPPKALQLLAPGVSRRHACIRVAGSRATR
jgi:hypothetical protein